VKSQLLLGPNSSSVTNRLVVCYRVLPRRPFARGVWVSVAATFSGRHGHSLPRECLCMSVMLPPIVDRYRELL
jgi:hypothetical protein